MVNNRTGRSAHSGLLINGSQQVLYDPAGTFTHPDLPRRGDIHYGMTPRFVDYYERYHARFDYFVEAQKVPISRATADQLIANAQARGESMKMTCGLDVADVLKPVPPFQGVPTSFFPEALRDYFEALPGVEDSYVYESDVGKNRVWERGDRPALVTAAAMGAAPGEPCPTDCRHPMPPPARRPGPRPADISILLHARRGGRG